MKTRERVKIVNTIVPVLANDADYVAVAVDTLGYSHIRFLFILGVTDIATVAAAKITDCATSGGSYADVTGAVFAAAFAADDDGEIHAIDIDLTGGKHDRYMKPALKAGNGSNGTNLCCLAILTMKDSGMEDVNAGVTTVISI